jgi:hypothetical protein
MAKNAFKMVDRFPTLPLSEVSTKKILWDSMVRIYAL